VHNCPARSRNVKGACRVADAIGYAGLDPPSARSGFDTCKEGGGEEDTLEQVRIEKSENQEKGETLGERGSRESSAQDG
jgi:hypothetical protein